ncbi:ATP-binding protein [Emticicia sp. W12TSBA100-4]|uniref:AAA family ATPase n=1 Tax=Emticicia sp. W12TSBA100-4 TaxID=3160965 RepID=UPI003305B589
MLIDFSVTNYRSIKDKQTFSMQPIKRIDELPEHIINNGKHSALSSAIIYGRNASGKSNLLRAMGALIDLVNHSQRNKLGKKIEKYEPFKLDRNSINLPTEFEITFLTRKSIKYTYKIIFESENIILESLFSFPNGREKKIFIREQNKKIDFGNDIKIGRLNDIAETLFPNQAFLAKMMIFSDKVFDELSIFFMSYIELAEEEDLLEYDSELSISKGFKERHKKILDAGDTGIIGFKEIEEIVNGEKVLKFKPLHNLYQNGSIVGTAYFDLEDESLGTRKLLGLTERIGNALDDGGTIIIDEFNNSLHPLLTKTLINLFHNPKTNPNGAQLIFATHDVSLLDNELFRRDQIWFSEKGNDGASTYYSLADLKGIRAGVPLEKYYLKGAFGATPIINEHDLVFNFREKNEQK